MISGLRCYWKYLKISLKGQMEYRGSFILQMIGHFFLTLLDFLGIWVLFNQFGKLKDWGLEEVALLYGTITIAFAISDTLSRGLDYCAEYVRTGEFDRFLIRPRSLLLQIIGVEFTLRRFGRLFQGLFVLAWALITLNIHWSLPKVLLMFFSIGGGTCLFVGLWIMQATISFWTVQGLEVVNITTYGGVETAQYPMSIYEKWFQNFFIFIIPLACVNFFPMLEILERPDPLAFPAWMHWVSPAAGILFLIASIFLFRFGVRHYRSTGS
ncbi:MAG: ABC-2 family transporter protein [Spirochaetales bacterium]|nr:ABC-2 family transporter protein [Spirochaetales bacterium]